MSAPLTPNPTIVDLTATYGALTIGTYFSFAFWGINAMQAYLYYFYFEKDALLTKVLVTFVMLLDTAHLALVANSNWPTLIKQWGDVAILSVYPQSALHATWVEYIIIGIVQLYFIRRIIKFSRAANQTNSTWFWLYCAFLGLLFLAQHACTIAYCALAIGSPKSVVQGNLVVGLSITPLVSGIVIDLSTTVGMVVLLRSQAATLAPTSGVIRRLSILVVNTGALTVAITIITLILDVCFSSQNNWDCVTLYPMCSFYILSFLANLNARHYVRGDGGVITISNAEFLDPSIGFTSGQDSVITASRPTHDIKLRRIGPSSTRVDQSIGSASMVVDKDVQIVDDDGFALRADMVFKEGDDHTIV
ncbi:unnamed protein product [Peniophora sp. CBMAI 1063]|nr:unnamed protein product [Peniophora sp. CBMAI 1063]